MIDDYETLPPDIARQNPAYYHALLKDAGFETERGWVDYKIEVTPEFVARYESALEASRRAGFQIVALRDVPAARRVSDFEHTWNTAFAHHWGATPFTTDELTFLFDFFAMSGALDTSVLAYRDGRPVGALMVTPPNSEGAILKPGRKLADNEKLNLLGIGVLEVSARPRRQPRYGGVFVPAYDPQWLEVSELHASAGRQLAVAPHGRKARRQSLRELRDLSPQLLSLFRGSDVPIVQFPFAKLIRDAVSTKKSV